MDLDAFFCAVEELADPGLRGKPFAVGGRPESRGVVASCSYPARAFGIHSAMPMAQAVRQCPDLIVISHRHGEYGKASRQVMARLGQVTPLIEQISIDEAFLDVTGHPDYATQIARDLQARINRELTLPVSFGVSTSKLVAKIANNIGKNEARTGSYPNAIKVVKPGQEAAFLAPLPVRELWGVGPKTAERLNGLGIKTIGDIAALPQDRLVRLFGRHGEDLARRAHGIDSRPVQTEHEVKSVSNETTFEEDIRDEAHLKRTLRRLCDKVGYRLRRNDLRGKTVSIKLRWSDFTTLTRQTTLGQATHFDDEIYREAVALFDANWPRGRAVRLIGVGVSGFEEAVQLGLFGQAEREEAERLSKALDEIKAQFGERTIRRGSDLYRQLEEED